MNISQNVKLAPYTTFKIGGPAGYFCVVENEADLGEAIEFSKAKSLPVLFIGGGSNMLISDKGFNGLAVLMDIKGYEPQEYQDHVILKVAPGEVWDDIVELANKQGWWGIENLSHIPGKMGALAVQNVGAYGQEAGQVVEKVTALDLKTGQICHFNNEECGFGYRSSIFNGRGKGKYAIVRTYLKLSKRPQPNLSYRDLRNYFGLPQTLSAQASPGHPPPKGENNNVLSLAEIREAIIYIRDKKFPFPKVAVNGNAGSFFKNLFLTAKEFENVKKKVFKTLGEGTVEILGSKCIALGDKVKLPAAFLLDLCGVKGIKHENAAINAHQPLVIVNATGKAKATDILKLVGKVLATVKRKTGLTLEIEPELVGFSSEELKRYGIIRLSKI